MHNHFLQGAFQAANHVPEIKEYLRGLKLHFNNYSSLAVKPSLHKTILQFKARF